MIEEEELDLTAEILEDEAEVEEVEVFNEVDIINETEANQDMNNLISKQDMKSQDISTVKDKATMTTTTKVHQEVEALIEELQEEEVEEAKEE